MKMKLSISWDMTPCILYTLTDSSEEAPSSTCRVEHVTYLGAASSFERLVLGPYHPKDVITQRRNQKFVQVFT